MSVDMSAQVAATVVHRKAESACCSAPLDLAPEEAPHDYNCRSCGQPAERVLGEPRHIPAAGRGILAAPGTEGGEG